MNDEHKPARVRSPSYPTIDLEAALEKVQVMYAFTRRTPVLIATMLPQWGFESGKSANGMKVVAALKSYGLIDDSGKKDVRKIALTDDAYRYIHLSNDSPERRELIEKFALSPDIYRYMWDTFGPLSEMPQDAALKSHLVLEKKFNESAVTGFLNDYKDTISFAGLKKTDTIKGKNKDKVEQETPPTEVKVGDVIQWTSAGIDQFAQPKKVRAITDDGEWLFVEDSETGIPLNEAQVIIEASKDEGNDGRTANKKHPPTMPLKNDNITGAGMKQDTFNLPGDEGAVIINWPSKLSKDAFEDFTDWLILQHRKIARDVEGSKKPKLERKDEKDTE